MRTLLLILALLAPAAQAQHPSPSPTQNIAEQYLLQQVNQHRAEHRLAPLSWDPTLARVARAHALLIARSQGPAEHQYPGEPDLPTRATNAGLHYSTISENVAGNAQSAPQLDTVWMNSPPHRTNILDPRLNAIGIAVIQSRGLLSAVQDFARTTADLTPNDVEAAARQALLTRNIQPETSTQARNDARQACVVSTQARDTQTYASSPTLIIQWEGSDLNQLPAAVLNAAPPSQTRNQTRTAAIAACIPNRQTQGFTTFRIAVLLY